MVASSNFWHCARLNIADKHQQQEILWQLKVTQSKFKFKCICIFPRQEHVFAQVFFAAQVSKSFLMTLTQAIQRRVLIWDRDTKTCVKSRPAIRAMFWNHPFTFTFFLIIIAIKQCKTANKCFLALQRSVQNIQLQPNQDFITTIYSVFIEGYKSKQLHWKRRGQDRTQVSWISSCFWRQPFLSTSDSSCFFLRSILAKMQFWPPSAS